MRARAISYKASLAGLALVALVACGGDEPSSAGTAQPLRCTLGEVRMCPCVGQGMGTQACNATGDGYSACMGCPAPGGAGGAGGAAGMTGGAGGAGGMGGVPGGAGSMGGMGGATGGSGGMSASGGTGGVEIDAGGPDPAGTVEPGTSCGVGLVVLCELETEKCCARSLATDTCIPAAETCSCDVSGCEVMEARCDGPEDCSDGEVCCGTLVGGAAYSDFVCAAQCDATGQQRIACHEQDDTCPTELICANSQLLTNVQVCIDPRTIEQ